MKRIVTFEQLERAKSNLFVEVVCPKCGRILNSLVPDAGTILIFGCAMCADIDHSMLFLFDEISTSSTNKISIQTEETEEVIEEIA